MSKFLKKTLFNKILRWNLILPARTIEYTRSILRPLTTMKPQKSVYLIDESDSNGNKSPKSNKYTYRTHNCGELNVENVGEKVVLCGWLQYQRMNKFVVLRDSYGETQLLITNKATQDLLGQMPYETIIRIKGSVLSRPRDMINKKQITGEIEIQVDDFQILNQAKDNLPFNIREFQKAKEGLRMQYRYLDIRFPQMQKNLRTRSKIFMKLREFLIENHFIDVETPTLFKATPGGAQEFIVPTRFPGKFYSLVQSPQQFKQMLMAGALDRYFQIAKCYRDEGSRPDRQPEFTQLDIELSFTDVEGIIKLIEELLFYALAEFTIARNFSRISYEEALEVYGTDKPDITFDFKLRNCTEIFEGNSLLNNLDDFACYSLVFDKNNLKDSCVLTKSVKEQMLRVASQHPKAKLIQVKVTKENFADKFKNLLSSKEASALLENISDGSVMFLAHGSKNYARKLLGKIRLEYVKYLEDSFKLQIRKKGLHFLWVLDFPLFEMNEESGELQSAHHPFTAPHPDDLALLNQDPLKIRALAYDLVLNGNEVGGGSIRIHDPVLQENILNLLKINKDTLQHIIDMLGSGCPPHGGIALGLDRLLALILNMSSIRDVIAFPKTFEGKEPISGAPSEVLDDTLKLYHIKTNK
ncbi:unnamed protein product [Ceutorhynchus assimilis]|uniref:Aminoacyl-transfer RNA synthetases class-II family profile domain-containing protein n=1 Tax=Ceutorhynchus assimilis TaxID=467358 RepID=A0A9N9MTK3_9CUCU|nr:unnamed protein product [Ceutorhynchus assimilis]